MNMRERKVLLVTRNLPPPVGGMENLLHRYAAVVGREATLTVIGPKGCSVFLEDGVRSYEVPASLSLFLLLSPFFSLRAVLGNRIDLVIGGSCLVAAFLVLLRWLFGVPTLCFPTERTA
jgi:phosphatidylinositol alpha-1,6-mannosyltransferase